MMHGTMSLKKTTSLRILNLIMATGENTSLNKHNFSYSVFKVRNMFYIGTGLKVFILWLLGIYFPIPTFGKEMWSVVVSPISN